MALPYANAVYGSDVAAERQFANAPAAPSIDVLLAGAWNNILICQKRLDELGHEQERKSLGEPTNESRGIIHLAELLSASTSDLSGRIERLCAQLGHL